MGPGAEPGQRGAWPDLLRCVTLPGSTPWRLLGLAGSPWGGAFATWPWGEVAAAGTPRSCRPSDLTAGQQLKSLQYQCRCRVRGGLSQHCWKGVSWQLGRPSETEAVLPTPQFSVPIPARGRSACVCGLTLQEWPLQHHPQWPTCPSVRAQINKRWQFHVKKYYAAVRKNNLDRLYE